MHTCPMVGPGPTPHVGGPILPTGNPTVLIGGLPAACVGDLATCVGPPDTIAKGSMSVFIGGRPAARMGDSTAHGGLIVAGLPTVMIGDAATPAGATIPGGGLGMHEANGGHLLRKHVGQTDHELAGRMAADNPAAVSTFDDYEVAERSAADAIIANQASIDAWMRTPAMTLMFEHQSNSTPITGRTHTRSAAMSQPAGRTRVVLKKNRDMPNGYIVLTGFPTL